MGLKWTFICSKFSLYPSNIHDSRTAAIARGQKSIYLFQLVFDVEGLPQKTTLIFNQLELILAPAMCKFVQENTYVNFDWTSQNLTLVSHLYKHL